MIIKRKLINFGRASSVLAALLLAVLVWTSTVSAGNYTDKQFAAEDGVVVADCS